MKGIKVFEAFSGVGTQRMALRNLGIEYEVVAIAEMDKYALASYEAIHGDCPNLGDISKIDPNTIPDHDLFTYSFPCFTGDTPFFITIPSRANRCWCPVALTICRKASCI